MRDSGNKSCYGLWTLTGVLVITCAAALGGCARSTLNGWAQNSPVIQPLPPVVHLGAKAEQ